MNKGAKPNEVSVIVVNWNGEQFLERCLVALVNQTLKPHEIIVVDNASTDGSIEIARRFPSVRLLAQNRNAGFSCGNNLAINAAAAGSEWIALLNPDAFPEPRWLEECLLSAQRNPQFDIFGSKLLNAANPVVLDGVGDAYHMSGLVWRTGHGTVAVEVADIETEILSPCAAAALYRRSALLRVGGFDEDFFCYVEDVDLGFRLRLMGLRSLYVPKSVVHHVGSGITGGKNSDFSIYHGHRNLVWTFIKNMPGVLFWILLPLHLALNVVSLIWFAFHGQGRVIWNAKRDAVKGLPKMWHKRQEIQKNRLISNIELWVMLNKRLIPTPKNSKQ